MIIATPLDIPTITPDDWDVFWKIWHRESRNLVKVRKNSDSSEAVIGQTGLWKGLDIYKKYDIVTAWDSPYYDIRTELPKLYQSIIDLPFNFVYRIRILNSQCDFEPHSDDNVDKWSVRAFLKHDSPDPQWYFTKPNKEATDQQFLKLPGDTNWFAYNDKHAWHGTIFKEQYPKLLIQVFFAGDIMPVINRSILKYKSHVIEI